jgi:hypothetical protein
MAKRDGQKTENSSPDYSTWVKMTVWKRPEAIALALGLDPERNLLDENGNGVVPATQEKYRKVLQRAFEAGAFPNPIQIAPSEFLSWLKSNRLEAPKPLLDAVAKQGLDVKDWRAECERLKVQLHAALSNQTEAKNRTTPTPKEETLYKIVIGVAYGRHDYDPDAKRNNATTQIRNEVERAGLSIDDQAILNALRAASEALNFDLPKTDR